MLKLPDLKTELYTDYELKQMMNAGLLKELQDEKHRVDIAFEWAVAPYLFTLRLCDEKKIKLSVNLNGIRREIKSTHLPREAALNYCVYFIGNYISRIETAADKIPDTYFDGLALLNLIRDCKSIKPVKVFSPIKIRKTQKRNLMLRPIEVSCALFALNQLISVEEYIPDAEAKKWLEAVQADFTLYSRLPEVSYVSSKIPEHALFGEFERIIKLVNEECLHVKEFALLNAMFKVGINEISLDDIFMAYQNTGCRFYLECAMRFLCYMKPGNAFICPKEHIEAFETVMNEYRQQSVSYHMEYENTGTKLLEDNHLLVRNTVNRVNRVLKQDEMICNSGTIHTYQ